ncbi:MAG: hypothetical protein WA172_03875 [Terriglobales bacterium]
MIDSLTTHGMANRELISEFEQGRAPGEFHHADHVRVAFAYVSEFPLLEAMAKFSAALQRFALSKGKPHLYHQSITWAYLLLIHERIARAGSVHSSSVQPSCVPSWEEFSERNPELLVWKGGILERYYSQAVLDSELARRVFVFPDQVDAACEKNALPQSG